MSDVISEDWFCPSHPLEHPSGVLLRLLSWELELRQVSVSSTHVQNKLQSLVRGMRKEEQIRVVKQIQYQPYDPSCSTDFYLKQLLDHLNDGDTSSSSTTINASASISASTSAVSSSAASASASMHALQQHVTYVNLTHYRTSVGSRISVDVLGTIDGTQCALPTVFHCNIFQALCTVPASTATIQT
jgi:hypothetical protein